jgi:predicted transcriptional regulator
MSEKKFKLSQIVDMLKLQVVCCQEHLYNEVTGGYASDMLSDVMANSRKGNIWITLQGHPNIVAVAKLKELSGIIIVNKRKPEEETVRKATNEKIPILITNMTTFEIVGKLYEAGIGN